MAIQYGTSVDNDQSFAKRTGNSDPNLITGIRIGKNGMQGVSQADEANRSLLPRDTNNKLGDQRMLQKAFSKQHKFSWETIVAPSGVRLDGTLVNGSHRTTVTYANDTAADETRAAPGSWHGRRAKTNTTYNVESKTG